MRRTNEPDFGDLAMIPEHPARPIEVLPMREGNSQLALIRQTTPAEILRLCLFACELAETEEEAREFVDMLVGADPERRIAVRAELVGLRRGHYGDELAARIADNIRNGKPVVPA